MQQGPAGIGNLSRHRACAFAPFLALLANEAREPLTTLVTSSIDCQGTAASTLYGVVCSAHAESAERAIALRAARCSDRQATFHSRRAASIAEAITAEDVGCQTNALHERGSQSVFSDFCRQSNMH